MKVVSRILITLVAASALLAGCGHEGSSVAVIDLNAVAKATGQDEAMRVKAAAARNELQSQLEQVAVNLDQQLNQEIEKIGDNPTAEQEQQLQQMNQNARMQLAELQQMAQQQAGQIEVAVVDEFKDQIRPLAEKVARDKGTSIIVTQDQSVFWYDASIDITDEVIAAWRAQEGDVSAEAEEVEEVEEELAEVEEELEEVEEELAEVEEELEELQEAVEEAEVVPAE